MNNPAYVIIVPSDELIVLSKKTPFSFTKSKVGVIEFLLCPDILSALNASKIKKSIFGFIWLFMLLFFEFIDNLSSCFKTYLLLLI